MDNSIKTGQINRGSKLGEIIFSLASRDDVYSIVDIESCGESFFTEYSKDIQQAWKNEDIANYNNIPNVSALLPDKIDLLILDGGEFSSLGEFHLLEDRTRFFVLDDTMAIKNFKASELIRLDQRFKILHDEPNNRNGFLVAERL